MTRPQPAFSQALGPIGREHAVRGPGDGVLVDPLARDEVARHKIEVVGVGRRSRDDALPVEVSQHVHVGTERAYLVGVRIHGEVGVRRKRRARLDVETPTQGVGERAGLR